MGQTNSLANTIPQKVDLFHDEFLRQARALSEIASLSYEDFLQCLRELNRLSKSCVDEDGKVIVFAVETGSDTSVFWRGKVRIACVKVDPATNKIDIYRFLTLNQFLKVFRSIQTQLTAAQQTHNQPLTGTSSSSERCSVSSSSSSTLSEHEPAPAHPLTAPLTSRDAVHLLTQGIEDVTNNLLGEDLLVECCICLDRKPDVMLPCAHSFCLPCLEQWNVNHKTCPICRESLESTEETWVISDIPNDTEITQDICYSLMNLAKIKGQISEHVHNQR